MIKDFQYYYKKSDLFYYTFITIGIFIYTHNSNVFNYDNIIPLVITLIIIYFILRNHNTYTQNTFQKMSRIYRNFDYDKYPNIKDDKDVIIILTSIKGLYDKNPVEFRVLLNKINEFLYEFSRINTISIYKDTIYSRLKIIASEIMNILNSFSINLRYKNAEINDLDIDTKLIETTINSYPDDLMEMQNWLSRKLTNIEIIINRKWLDGKININSSPIYPDDVGGVEYNFDNYNIY